MPLCYFYAKLKLFGDCYGGEILKGLSSVFKVVKRVLSVGFNKIKKGFSIIFKAVKRFFIKPIMIVLKKIFNVLKLIIFHLIVKPILFLYDYIVKPFGKLMAYIGKAIFKYIIKPFGIAVLFILSKIWLYVSFISIKIFKAVRWVFNRICKVTKAVTSFIYKYVLYPIYKVLLYIYK